MWNLMFVLVLLGAQLNLSGIVPLKVGDPSPPWFVGGRLIWPFAVDTNTLIKGDLLNTLTPILAISAGILFLMAAGALLHWFVPEGWFTLLVITGAILSIALQIIWFSAWAVFPLLVDIALLWFILGQHVTVASLRG